MARIWLRNAGRWAKVDDELFAVLSGYSWFLRPDGYVAANVYKNGKRAIVKMHHIVLRTLPGVEVDHINGNRRDNRRENLRLASKSQNQANRKLNKNSTTGYKGVSFDKGKYRASIGGKPREYLGSFDTAQEAAIAYNAAAQARYGAFAGLNLVTW
jgi:hypothetical protein